MNILLYTSGMHKGLLIVSCIGLIVSGYLTITYASNNPIACVSGEGCKIAQLSIYSSFMGIQTPIYGLVYYFTLGIIAALWSEDTRKKLQLPLAVLTSAGVGVSLFLSSIEAFVLHAWCSWCVASAILTVIAFIIFWKVSSQYDTHI